MKIEVYLCSFASPDLDLSVKRFINQASDLNFYKDIKVFRKKDLSDKNTRKNFRFIKDWKEAIIRICCVETRYNYQLFKFFTR